METPVIPDSIAERIQKVHDRANEEIAAIMAGLNSPETTVEIRSPYEIAYSMLADERYNLRTLSSLLSKSGYDSYEDLEENFRIEETPVELKRRIRDGARLVGFIHR